MQTISHLVLTAAAGHTLRRQSMPIHTVGLLIGSFLPDVPFTLLTIGYGLYYRLTGLTVPALSVMEYLHFDLFFNDPV